MGFQLMEALPFELQVQIYAGLSPKQRAAACTVSRWIEQLCVSLLPPLSLNKKLRNRVLSSNYHAAVRMKSRVDSRLVGRYGSADELELCWDKSKMLLGACTTGNYELIEIGFNCDTKCLETSLRLALQHGHLAAAKRVFAHLDAELIDAIPLIRAAHEDGSAEIIKFAMKITRKGIGSVSSRGRAVLEGLAAGGHLDRMKQTAIRFTLSMITAACMRGRLEMVKFLVGAGGQLEAVHWLVAVQSSCIELIRWVFDNYAPDSAEIQKSLRAASAADVYNFLTRKGAITTEADLEWFCRFGRIEIVVLITVPPSTRCVRAALSGGHADVAALLPYEKGLNYPIIMKALHYAASGGTGDLAQLAAWARF